MIEERYGVLIEGLDFSEHDKYFKDRIAKLEDKLLKLIKTAEQHQDARMVYERKCEKLKQRIAELESKETEKPTKINLNDLIKVKLTPLGAEIYYHQYDEVNKKIKENGGTELEPMMPQIDKDRFTEFQLWHFIELYGEHIGVCKKNVIEPLDIIIA